MDIAVIKQQLLNWQRDYCSTLEQLDGQATFKSDAWQRQHGGGGGLTRVLEGGAVFERGAVNFSHVMGEQLPPSATANRPELVGRAFQALGVSLIMHPVNPYVPTVHANLRYFIAPACGAGPAVHWYGGGFDLTPYYGFEEDCVHWHEQARLACSPFGKNLYSKYKKWADDYFYNKHRQEPRGIGGLFFDDVTEVEEGDPFSFWCSVGDHLLPAYVPILSRRLHQPYGERERQFQLYRRGRYVEFNLVYDRGTLFGLQSGGRAESILVSMPPLCRFEYDYRPQPDTPESELLERFLRERDWLGACQ